MQTRRQKLILQLIRNCHALLYHPSPAALADLIEHSTGHRLGGGKTIRAELIRLLEDGSITAIEVGRGTAGTRYTLSDCPCPYCTPRS
jgi:hypothetical protein